MKSGSDWQTLSELTPWLHRVKVMVAGINDFRGHDPAHEEYGTWKKKGQHTDT